MQKKFRVGQKVILISPGARGRIDSEVSIHKVGSKYVHVSVNGSDVNLTPFSIEDGSEKPGGYGYTRRIYTLAEFAEVKRRNKAIDRIYNQGWRTTIASGAKLAATSTEKLEKIADILESE